jgi:hypothetical protein
VKLYSFASQKTIILILITMRTAYLNALSDTVFLYPEERALAAKLKIAGGTGKLKSLVVTHLLT